ncbi:MAG: MarR family transcriptional regulator [Proteobacteria bacterium]|nr:MarR family transcriptional regulator [Pseudomonadota bacterium]
MQPAAKLDTATGTKPSAECEYVLETQIGHLLRRAHQRHVAQFEKEVGDLDLTPTQFAALAKISERGEVSQNLLGRMTAMDPATIQGVIQRLMARGLIDRRPDPNDRRATLLRLSTPGRTLTREAIRRAHRVSHAVLEPMSPEERAQMTGLLRKLTELT